MSNEVLPSDLMNSVIGKLYDVLTNGDSVAPPSPDNYLAWCTPGVPYAPEEFDFCSEGLTGIHKKRAGDEDVSEDEGDSDDDDTSVEELNQLLAQDATRKYIQAENLARFADLIPDTSGIEGTQTVNVWNVENTLSQAYEHLLRFCQVADIEPDARTKKKLERLRGLLQTKKIERDIITEEETEVMVDSPLVKKYFEKMQNYMSVALEYNTYRINALAANDPVAVHFWALNGPILRNKVIAARGDWIANGYKEQYEKIAAYLAHVEGRNMVSLLAQYKDDLDKSTLSSLASGADFYYTSLIPGGFARTNQGWTKFSFAKSDFDSHYDYSSRKTGASGGLNFGLFSIGGTGGSKKTEVNSKVDASTFSLSFFIAQIPIIRPWFNTNFLVSKYWRFDQANPAFKNQMISDGKRPPNGMLPAYTTTCLFIKDLSLNFSERDSTYKSIKTSAHGGGFVSYGPFAIGGSHKQDNFERDTHADYKDQGISVEGMQLIGFKCHMLPESPAPNPSILDWV